MSLESRPYIGTWQIDRKVVKHTPDALVYFNGDLSIPGCPTCAGKIDLQRYITQVSADPSTEGPATASISLHVPRTAGDGWVRDGNFIIRPGIEVHIYMRGYFPVQGLTSGITPEETGGVDVNNAVMYPYYLVHHGVIVDVNYEYSGGEHTATLSCADMLHFWQYQRMSYNGSLFGARPTNSKVKMSLVGHTMSGMSPYAIIYQLFRDVQGSAGGVEFALGNKTNAAANSTVVGESLFSLSILYWQKRFSQTMMSLRMYGADGTLYNALQAAFLASLKAEDPVRLATKYGAKNAQSMELDPLVRASRITGWDPYSVGLGAEGSNNESKIGINVSQLQAFTSDISQWGNVNFFESAYSTKIEIANNVKEACGYEFYQDVDGDIVFKPPFYNLDTSGSRVYRIEDIDIISLSTASKEPEATVVKATGGHFRSMTGTGLENNEWGTRAEFIDYRLVAQFGWRQSTFESTYHTDSQALFFACVARFDIFNIGVNSATLTIPLRPELRPGYPVYIVGLDCYYYIHSFNHSMSFGGQCTTTLNLVGRRAKFLAPGQPPLDGSKATISNIRLDNMHLPQLPLEITEVDGVMGIPKMQGFPNVVMALDPNLINPLSFVSTPIDDLQTEAGIRNLIAQARSSRYSVLQQGEDQGSGADEQSKAFDGPFQIPTGSDTPPLILPSISELLSQARKLKSIYDNTETTESDRARIEEEAAPLLALVDLSRDVHSQMFPDTDSSATYLELLSDVKAAYNPGVSLPGYYRYYSSAHPDPAMQGPASWSVGSSGVPVTGALTKPDDGKDQTAVQFKTTDSGGLTLEAGGKVLAGIPLIKSGTIDQTVSTPTHQIATFQIARFRNTSAGTKSTDRGAKPSGFPPKSLGAAYQKFFLARMDQVPVGPTSVVGDVFRPVYDLIAKKIQTKIDVYPVFPDGSRTFDQVSGIDNPSKIQTLAAEMAAACADTASDALTDRMKSAFPTDGELGSKFGTRNDPITGALKQHKGQDIKAAIGTPIQASLAGKVLWAGPRGDFGNLVQIEHPNGLITRYAHCQDIFVSVGQQVEAGQEIATVGSTGKSTGPHLHFELLDEGKAVNPEAFLKNLGGTYDAHDLEQAWTSIWPEGTQVQSGVGRNRKNRNIDHVKYYDSPVFPVSDARGYEVVGTYRYGRGLSLESLDKLSGFSTMSTADYESVEAFLDVITKDASDAALSVAIGNLSPALKAQLASRTMSDSVTNILKMDDPGGSQHALQGANFPTDRREFTQKSTLTNVAYGLADMNATVNRRSICSCKGAEADVLLQAFDASMYVGVDDVDVGDTEQVQDWLSEQMVAESVNWASTQSAYRGTILDAKANSVTKAVSDAVASYTNLIPGRRNN